MLKNSLYTLKIGVLVEPSDKLKEIEKLKEKKHIFFILYY